MRGFCFTCEQRRTREYVCRACGERECTLCGDAQSGLCAACSYEVASALSLQEVLTAARRA